MGRGYWLPPGAKQLAAYDGFYIDGKAVYKQGVEQGWENLLAMLCQRIPIKEKTFQKNCEWRSCKAGLCRFVVLQNRYADIVADDADGYVAV